MLHGHGGILSRRQARTNPLRSMRRIARITGYSEQELLTMAIADAEAVQSAENIRTDNRIRRCKPNLHE